MSARIKMPLSPIYLNKTQSILPRKASSRWKKAIPSNIWKYPIPIRNSGKTIIFDKSILFLLFFVLLLFQGFYLLNQHFLIGEFFFRFILDYESFLILIIFDIKQFHITQFNFLKTNLDYLLEHFEFCIVFLEFLFVKSINLKR